MALGLTPYQKQEVRQMILEELLRVEKLQQESCRHTEGEMHEDGRVTCKGCHKMLTPPYEK